MALTVVEYFDYTKTLELKKPKEPKKTKKIIIEEYELLKKEYATLKQTHESYKKDYEAWKTELRYFKDDRANLNFKLQLAQEKYYKAVGLEYDEETLEYCEYLYKDEKKLLKFIELRNNLMNTIEDISGDIKEVHYKNLLDTLMKMYDVL